MNNMDYRYIEQLLERYFAAETTLQEEQILKAFFAQSVETMPQSLSRYATLFTLLGEKATDDGSTLPDDFDARMLRAIEGAPVVKAKTVKLRERLRPLFRAAAVVAIIVTFAGAINQAFQQAEPPMEGPADSYAEYVEISSDPAMAYEVGQRADTLLMDTLGLRP
jgi:hypothetical protein